MATDTGHPSGANKSDKGAGIPQKVAPERQRDDELTEQYTNDDNALADGVRTANPNRNTDKTDATNAGGYRN